MTRTKATVSALPAPAPGRTRREQVIDAAAHVFSQLGYHGTGTRAIAEVLGIQVASLYSHFRSKDDALELVCRLGIAVPLEYLREAVNDGGNLEQRIRLFFAAHCRYLQQSGEYVSVYMNERRYLPPDARHRINRISREVRAEMDHLLAEALLHGELHPDLDVRHARLVMIGVLRNVTQFYLEGPIRGFEAFVVSSIDHLLRGLGPVAPAPRANEQQ